MPFPLGRGCAMWFSTPCPFLRPPVASRWCLPIPRVRKLLSLLNTRFLILFWSLSWGTFLFSMR
jgi:hypothetical protein